MSFEHTIFFQIKVRKKIVKNLPTRDEPCVTMNYVTCVSDFLAKKYAELDKCSVPFLYKNTTFSTTCSKNITLNLIQEWKLAMKKDEFDQCLDLKQCNSVEFNIVDKGTWKESQDGPVIKIELQSYIVESITDSYDYDFISIFSEIGGSLGILVGLSIMTLVEFFIDLQKGISKLKLHFN